MFGPSYAAHAAWSLRILSLESLPFIIKNHYITVSRIQRRVAHATLLTIGTGGLELGGAALGAHLGGLTGLSFGWFIAMCIEAVFMSPVVYRAARSTNASTYINKEYTQHYEDIHKLDIQANELGLKQ